MRPPLIGIDPGGTLLDIMREELPDVPIGFDMPDGERKVWLTLSMGAMQTPVSQRCTLTISAYSATSMGTLDWHDADTIWRRLAASVLQHAATYPLVDAQLQAGPMTNHDTQLDVDYVYGALMLNVTAR